MKVIYVCSPFRGDTKEEGQRNVDYAVELTAELLRTMYYPITPHLYITACLNDADPEERRIGMDAALALLDKCDAVMVGIRYGISEGMAAEITKAKRMGIPIFTHSDSNMLFKELTIHCDRSSGIPKTTVIVDNKQIDRITNLSFTHDAEWDPMLTIEQAPGGYADGTGKKL